MKQVVRLLKYIAVMGVLSSANAAIAQTDSTAIDSTLLVDTATLNNSQPDITPICIKSTIHEDYYEHSPCGNNISQDTSLTNFQYYHPLYRKYVGFQHLGNIGSAYKNLYFTPQHKMGFDFGINTFNDYLFDAQDAPYYSVDTPITQLWYSQGAQNMIYLRGMHTQNFGERLNVGVNFRRLASDGLYFNQPTDYYNTQLTTNYFNRTFRYKVSANVTFNRMDNQENGGVTSDSIFESLEGPGKLPPVNLNAQNKYKSNAYYIKQEYSLKKPSFTTQFVDSNKTDTFYKYNSYAPKLVHEVSYSNNSWSYIDPAHDSAFYPRFYKDTLATFDSNNIKTFTNKLALYKYWRSEDYQYNYEIMPFINNELIELNELEGYSANYNNTSLGVNLGSRVKTYSLAVNAEQYISGYNKDDQNLKLLLGKEVGIYKTISLAYHTQKTQPAFSQRYYSSNNYFFSNEDFQQELVNRVRLTYVSNDKYHQRYMLSTEQKTVNNYIYYDTSAQVQQATDAISVTSFMLQKNFSFGKVHFDNSIVYQITNNDSLLRLPDFMSKSSLYYETFAFHKSLKFQVGVNLFYTTEFKGYAYSPALRQFYIQNEATIGGYPQVDVFLTGKVKSFLFSAKMEHVNEGFAGERYYASAHHPLNGRVFRLGLAWRLID